MSGGWLGFFAPWLLPAWILALHLALPARRVEGYVRAASGEPLRYRLNGLAVMLVTGERVPWRIVPGVY